MNSPHSPRRSYASPPRVISGHAIASRSDGPVDYSFQPTRSPPLRRQVLSPDSPTWCSAQNACHGSRLRAKRGAPSGATRRLRYGSTTSSVGLCTNDLEKPSRRIIEPERRTTGGRRRGRPARRAGASPVTSAFGAEDGWGCRRTGPVVRSGGDRVGRRDTPTQCATNLTARPFYRPGISKGTPT
jgi:hypothetical protein